MHRSLVPALLGAATLAATAPVLALAQPGPEAPAPLQVTTFPPADGVDVVAPMAPSWCDVATPRSPSSQSSARRALERQFMAIKSSGLGETSLVTIATMLCDEPGDEGYRTQTGQVVQAWVNLTGLTAAQAATSIRARVDAASWKRQREETCTALAVSPEASGRALELARATARVFGCGAGGLAPYWRDDSNPPDHTLAWFLDDEPTPPSQTIASYRVLRCLPRPGSGALSESSLGRYASCGLEARALDPAQLETELAASGWNEYAKITAREQHGAARRRVTVYEREVRALAAKDPAYQQIFYDAPRAGWETWDKLATTHKDALAAAFAYEARFVDNPARATGCRSALQAPLATWIAGQHASTVADAEAVLRDGLGYVLGTHLAACLSAEGMPHIAVPLLKLYEKGRPARGPRLAAHYAAAEAIAAVRADRPRFPLTTSIMTIDTARDLRIQTQNLIGSKLAYGDVEKGVVKSAKRDGEWVAIVFKTETWKETNWSCKDTHSVERIDLSGHVYYRQDCQAAGSRTVSKTPRAIRVPAEYAAGVKPGTFVVFWSDSFGSATDRKGAVREVWASKDQKKLIAYLGFAL